MTNMMLSPKLALVNIKKHGKLYLPYIISAAFTTAMFYVMCEITFNDGITKMYGGSYLSTVLGMGDIVIGIFSTIFLLYTNSFLMKQRKREMGLYNVLGMEKKHISKIMFFETFFVALISIASGLLIGIIFDKLVTLFLCKLLHSVVDLGGFTFSIRAIILTCAVFLMIFFVSFVSNVIRVKRSKTIELLHSEKVGEKEPRTKIILTILGVALLTFAYICAVTVESPLQAINLFFFAVLAVILGTYCLFIAGSITVLKLLRKKKNYFYNSKHFTSVSGMLYRMKQNAVGLANICILSTMVLVMVSTTVSMYAGTEDSLRNVYPKDINISFMCTDDMDEFSAEEFAGYEDVLVDSVRKTVADSGHTASNLIYYEYLNFATTRVGNEFFIEKEDDMITDINNLHELCFVTAEQCKQILGKEVVLNKGEVLVCDYKDKIGDSFDFFGKTYTVKQHLDDFPDICSYSSVIGNIHYVVVPDSETFEEIYYAQLNAYEDSFSLVSFILRFDLDGTEEEKISLSEDVDSNAEAALKKAMGDDAYLQTNCRDERRAEFASTYGSFFFLGIVLGLLFMVITVMIIYYKQISEGYDDKKRFEIMQQVGMSKEEVRKTIKNQVLTVFFLPLVTACIHLAFSFPIISKLLLVFNLTNTTVFLIALIVTAAVFAVIYAIVYILTARAYYKIVS